MDIKDFKERHAEAIEWAESHFSLMHSLVNALAVGMESLQMLEPMNELVAKAKAEIESLDKKKKSSEKAYLQVNDVVELERKKLSNYKAERSVRLSEIAADFNREERAMLDQGESKKKEHLERLEDLKMKEVVVELEIENRRENLDVLEKKISALRESIGAVRD